MSQNVESVAELLLLEPRIPKARLKVLRGIGTKKGWRIVDTWSSTTTHIVTAYDNVGSVLEHLKLERDVLSNTHVATLEWLTNCFSEEKVGPVYGKYIVEGSRPSTSREKPPPRLPSYVDTKYECQKATPLHHQNKHLTDALETLEKAAHFREDEARALAFRRASCALKSLPRKVTALDQVIQLHHIGSHAAKVVRELLEDGYCGEVDDILADPWFRTMTTLTLIYGCGVVTARKWHALGISDLSELKKADRSGKVALTKRQRLGVQYFEDLATPVSTVEAAKIEELIREQANNLSVDAGFCLVGGQRRGKDSGHDVDLMIKVDDDIDAGSYLQQLIEVLQDANMLISVDYNSGSASESAAKKASHSKQKLNRPVTMDTLHKAFTIFKYPSVSNTSDGSEPPHKQSRLNLTEATFVARRVDIIIAKASQFPVALLGWTGSKQFNRSLRLLASKEHNIEMSNTSIWDCAKQPPQLIQVKSEEDIFALLGLPCFDPIDRNC